MPLTIKEIETLSAADGSADLPTIIDYINNPTNYEGKIFYLSAIGSTIYGVFDTPKKFYHNQGGIWFESSFFFG